MVASPSGPQLTPGGQMSGPIRSISKFLLKLHLSVSVLRKYREKKYVAQSSIYLEKHLFFLIH